MSLACNECRRDMGPSETFPGREGTFVYPVLLSLVYVPAENGAGYTMKYLKQINGRSLCFECIENQMHSERKEKTIKPVYEAYEAEINLDRIEEDRKGRFLVPEDHVKLLHAYNEYDKRTKEINPECIFCDGEVENGKPFFVPVVIDKVHSEKVLSGLFVPTNYSWSTVKSGSTRFRICFDDFRNHFAKTFESLSYDMTGEINPNIKPNLSELYITPAFEKALEEQTGQSFDEYMDKLIKETGLNNIAILRKLRDKK